jgi:hypothetical protein
VIDVKYLSRAFEEDAIYQKINREWKKVRDEQYEVCEWKIKVQSVIFIEWGDSWIKTKI